MNANDTPMGNVDNMKMKYTVINNEDLKFLPKTQQLWLVNILGMININRMDRGKSPDNRYLVINTDEPYADEVISIMKKHEHWG